MTASTTTFTYPSGLDAAIGSQVAALAMGDAAQQFAKSLALLDDVTGDIDTLVEEVSENSQGGFRTALEYFWYGPANYSQHIKGPVSQDEINATHILYALNDSLGEPGSLPDEIQALAEPITAGMATINQRSDPSDWFSATDTNLAALLQDLTNQLQDLEDYGAPSLLPAPK